MPGLNQLKQFNSDLLNLGDEVKIRAARGEKAVRVPIPASVSDEDDSEDFRLGMPTVSEEELQQADARATELDKQAQDFPMGAGTPDVSDLLAPATDLEDLDLSDFEEAEPVAEAEPVPEEPAPETPLEDLDLDSLLAGSTPDAAPQQDSPAERRVPTHSRQDADESAARSSAEDEFDSLLAGATDETPAPEAPSPAPEEPAATETAPATEDNPFDLSDLGADFDFDDGKSVDMNEGIPEEFNETPGAASEEPAATSDDFDIDAVLNNAATAGADSAAAEPTAADSPAPEAPSDDLIGSMDGGDFELPDFDDSTFSTDAPGQEAPAADATETFDLDDIPLPDGSANDTAGATDSAGTAGDGTVDAGDALPDFGDLPDFGEVTEEAPAPERTAPDAGKDASDDDFIDSLLDGIDLGDAPPAGSATDTAGGDAFDTSAMDDFNATAASSDDDEFGPPPDFSADDDDAPAEQFDTSAMEGMDFSDDGMGDDSFHIPGYSDTDIADIKKKPQVATPDFSNAVEADDAKKPKNTFTDAEYKRFRKNLAEYPLNLRIALEDFVVKNEFTDDAVFDVLDKVLRKAPARQIASQLEKLMDISIDVPRDYERRTAAEYEAYKQTLEYKLRNRIIPGAILTAAAALLIGCIGFLSVHLVYNPLMANKFYKQGYECIAENQYSQAEANFETALGYRAVKNWYFKYAERYREHKQYERARKMYWALLKLYNHDKKAGLDWADMEMSDLYNYEEAERIIKREVLDYHINDPEAILKLGDLYLEWADSGVPEKYPLAKEQYELLVNEYGDPKKQDFYLGRLMRYYIRMDDLASVLQYKELFYPNKLKALSADDLTELSGYLLDKRYSALRPSEESMRTRIENVRTLLEEALKKDESNPIALYNLGRYSVFTHTGRATDLFRSTIDAFQRKARRSKKDTYTFINSYRLLGEQYAEDREYILAQQTYNSGIDLFENEHKNGSLETNENIGKLYADLGDLNYFINGDMAAAFDNYTNAVENKNDTASVHYKIGYIHYTNQNFKDAQGSFTLGLDTDDKDEHLLLALGNTLCLSGSYWAAQGYYERLLNLLNTDFEKYSVIIPQVRDDQGDLVDTYMRATNNLGVTLSRLSGLNGDSNLNGKAIVNLQESMRSWDALTRNQQTMVRLGGSNLAEQNIKYITNPNYGFDPAIYTEIPKALYGEEGLTQ